MNAVSVPARPVVTVPLEPFDGPGGVSDEAAAEKTLAQAETALAAVPAHPGNRLKAAPGLTGAGPLGHPDRIGENHPHGQKPLLGLFLGPARVRRGKPALTR